MTTPADRPGIVHDLDEAVYHADRGSLSHSGAKLILKAPALYRWRLDHPEHKDVFDFGKAAHAKVLGIGSEVVIVQREIRNRKGELLDVIDAPDYKSDSAQQHRTAIRAEGKTPLLASEARRVDDMALALSRHRLAMRLLSHGQPEVSAYAPDPETGVLRRCRFDYLTPGIVTDYKTASSADPHVFARAAASFGYHTQHSWYLDVARACGIDAEAFAFLVQEKEPPYLVSVVELDQAAEERGRELNARALRIFAECVAADEWPGYAPDTDPTTVPLPRWAFYDDEELTA